MSGMTDTRIVLGFLDVTGQWNPALLLVMVGALAVTVPAFYFVLKKNGTPMLCDQYTLPAKRHLDAKLLGGTAIFGIGWGLYGYCPGPALASLSTLNPEPLLFVAAMAAGMIRK